MLFIGTDQCLCSILELVLSLRLLSALIRYHSRVKFKHFSFCLLYVLIPARNLNQQPLYVKKTNLNSRHALNPFAELGHGFLCKPVMPLHEQVLQASRSASLERNSCSGIQHCTTGFRDLLWVNYAGPMDLMLFSIWSELGTFLDHFFSPVSLEWNQSSLQGHSPTQT